MVANHKKRKTRLRAWRESQGLTLENAAKRIGRSRSLYAQIESGRLQPTEAFADQLEELFGEAAEELLMPVDLAKVPSLMTERHDRIA